MSAWTGKKALVTGAASGFRAGCWARGDFDRLHPGG